MILLLSVLAGPLASFLRAAVRGAVVRPDPKLLLVGPPRIFAPVAHLLRAHKPQ